VKKFKVNLARRFDTAKQAEILALCQDQAKLEATSVNQFVDMLVV
jgi:2-methylcitrate dehydratase